VSKKPKQDESTSSKRVPVESPADSDAMSRHLRFRFNRVDIGSPWCLTDITKAHLGVLINRMKDLEAMSANEVFKGGKIGKDENVAEDSPNRDAQKRARAEYPNDYERIARIAVQGKERLWGLRFENEFHVIWWDPEHEVWPSQKKHT